MATLLLSWSPGIGDGNTIRNPDAQKIFLHYRDFRQQAKEFEVDENEIGATINDCAPGKWTVEIRSKKDGEFSDGSPACADTVIVDGTLVDPGTDTTSLPTGVADIADPSGLSIQVVY